MNRTNHQKTPQKPQHQSRPAKQGQKGQPEGFDENQGDAREQDYDAEINQVHQEQSNKRD